ncbi:IS1634 family transposase [bacterium]|nr:IS1634 family transposase [bacterium]
MSYFLKKTTPSKKGLYLQIYEGKYIPGKGKRNFSFKSLGYVSDLKAKGIDDPIAYGQRLVDELNSADVKQIGDVPVTKNLGYFLLKIMLDALDIDDTLRIMSRSKKLRFDMPGFLRAMIYAQVVNPGSKLNAFEKVLPALYDCETFSYDQILDTVQYIGEDYQKYIDLFNHQITKLYGRKTEKTYFDCTNYYFEIDFPFEDKQKGASKELRNSPIIGQALMLDAEQIPIAMTMYPGNQSEKPFLRDTIEGMKTRYDISGKVIQVADKGLNCAQNIYSAVKEANDGYIFSKAILGTSLSQSEREWVLYDNDVNVWHNVYDSRKNLCYRYKEAVDSYEYKFRSSDGRGDIHFTVKEKRIVTYNPRLAKKKQSEIAKEVEKAMGKISLKSAARADFGDCAKYVTFVAKDKQGKVHKIRPQINQDKIDEAMKYAGYNLLVTSETAMSAEEIYNAYHQLWRIEESFRIMKTYLEARPVFLQTKESIYGHFLICYLALTTLRLLEFKVFGQTVSTAQLIDYIRSFNVTEQSNGEYINNLTKSETYQAVEKVLGIAKIGQLYLKKKDLKAILDAWI